MTDQPRTAPPPDDAPTPETAHVPRTDDAPGAGPGSALDGAADPDGAPDGRRAPWASVTACPHGPLLVRGDVEILLGSGRPAARRRSTVALCRCGASGIKPFCDGSHKAIGFRTEDEPL